MAWYRAGTATFTNGSKNVTGTGTTWVSNVRPGDEIIGPDNISREVESVTADSALSMVEAYSGATTAGASYKVKPIQGWNRDVAAQLAALINDYGSVEAALSELSVLSGNVGIGINSPAAALHVAAAADGAESLRLTSGIGDTANGSRSTEIRATSASGVYFQDLKLHASSLQLLIVGAERMRMDTNGNVGIGTPVPSAKLHVNGTVRLDVSVTGTNSGPGGADALPSAPAGYALINIGGLDRKVPYYP